MKKVMFFVCSALVILAASFGMVSRKRIGHTFTILEGKGVEGFMTLDDNPFICYLANPMLLSLRSKGRDLVAPRLGLLRNNLTWPQISIFLRPEDMNLADDTCDILPFKGRSDRLGDIDGKLDVRRVIGVYGDLPKVDCEKLHGFPFGTVLLPSHFPMTILYPKESNGCDMAEYQYRGLGISFESCGGKITEILVYRPQPFDDSTISLAGEVALGIDRQYCVGCFERGRLFVVTIKNSSNKCVLLREPQTDSRGVVSFAGTTKLDPNSATVLVSYIFPCAKPDRFQISVRAVDAEMSGTEHCIDIYGNIMDLVVSGDDIGCHCKCCCSPRYSK